MRDSEAELLKMRERADDAFNDFISAPTTKVLLTLIPPSDHPEAVKTLLRSAFDCGNMTGHMSVMLPLMETIMKKDK